MVRGNARIAKLVRRRLYHFLGNFNSYGSLSERIVAFAIRLCHSPPLLSRIQMPKFLQII
jgi:hypothetical protein